MIDSITFLKGEMTIMDVLIAGRLNIDLFAQPVRTPLSQAHSFERALGGFAGNVATATARLGLSTGVISRVGNDGHGEFARHFLTAEGIDVSQISTDPYWPTPLAFLESWPPDRFPITYYRKPTATDLQLRSVDIDWSVVEAARALCVSGTAFVEGPSADTTLALLRRTTGLRVLDLDYRASLWDELERYRAAMAEAASLADIVLGNEEELIASGLLAWRNGVLVEKRGAVGVILHSVDGSHPIPPHAVDVVNGLGSGDAFCGALVWGMLTGMSTIDAAGAAGVAGAIVAAKEACSTSMPTRDELTATVERWRRS